VVAALYERLERLRPSPAVRLNRAVAVAEAYGPEAGLALLADLDAGLGHQLPAARAELLARLGRTGDAAVAYDRAVELAGNAVVRAHLAQRRAALGPRARD
jgi:RNA polymerase sigma-70 factor (ECF subfamily)